MRKFRIIGLSDGAEWNLNDLKHFIYAPKNLGIKFKNEYIKVLNSMVKVTSAPDFEDFNSTILFKNYEIYEQFRSFLSKNRTAGFKFYYSPYLGLERYIVCDIRQLTKEELTFDGTLRSGFTITPQSHWLFDTVQVLEFTDTTSDGKEYSEKEGESGLFKYAYEYAIDSEESGDFKYNYVYITGGRNEAVLINAGDYETSLKITLNGAFTNPYLQLINVNDQTVQDARFQISVDADEKFIINSDPKDLKIVLVNAIGEELDRTDTQDYEKTTYLRLPIGEFRLSITTDTSEPITGSIEFVVNYTGG